MSATPIAVPVQVVWTVTASGQSASVTPATPMQVAVAQVHLGLKGATGDMHPGIPLMVQQAAAAAEAAATSADRVDLGALDQAVEDAAASAGAAGIARDQAVAAKLAAEAAAADAANKVDKSGGIMTGPLSVPAGAFGAEVPQAQEVALLATTQLGFRNRAINGNFSINQGAVSGPVVLAAGAYGHDQWKAGAAGCTYTFAAADGVNTITISAGSLVQPLEGVSLRTGTHTLSWTGTAQGKIGAGAYGAPGITGVITGGVDTTIEFTAGTLSLVQLERGDRPTVFEFLDPSSDFLRCERFYEKGEFFMVGAQYASAGYGGYARFKVGKRVAPTVTATYSNVGMSGMAVSGITSGGCRISGTGAIGAVLIAASWTANARI